MEFLYELFHYNIDLVIVFLCAIAVMIALSYWLVRRKETTWFLLFFWGISLLVLFTGAWKVLHEEKVQRDTWTEYLCGITKSIASATEESGHHEIRPPLREGSDSEKRYHKITRLHENWCRELNLVGYVFTLRLIGENQVEFICSCPSDVDLDGKVEGPNEQGDPPFTPYMEEDSETGKLEYAWYNVYQAGFEGKTELDAEVFSDQYGHWATAVSPLYDEQGNIEAILGVDFRVDSWVALTRTLRNRSMIVLVVVYVLFFSGTVFTHVARFSLIHERRLNERLLAAQQAAESAAKAKNFFLSNMSHEIRTPMNGILGFVDILESNVLAHCTEATRKEGEEILRIIRNSGEDLVMIINNLLEFTNTQCDHVDVVFQPTDLRELVREIIGIHRTIALEKGIRFEVSGEENLPATILTDANRLRHLLLNVVENAVKFTEVGSVSLEISCRKPEKTRSGDSTSTGLRTGFTVNPDSTATNLDAITSGGLSTVHGFSTSVEMSPDSGSYSPTGFHTSGGMRLATGIHTREKRRGDEIHHLSIAVIDSGIGMFPEEIELLFHPFSQLDSSSTRKYGGAGLGLAVARGIARLLGGNIIIDSKPGVGTMCVIQLPLIVPKKRSKGGDATQRGKMKTLPEKGAPLEEAREEGKNETSTMKSGNTAISSPEEGKSKVVDFSPAIRPLKDLKILLVEDMVINQMVLTSVLHQAGAKVEIAENGKIGIDKVREHGEPFDVILMDMQMPVLDGYEATRILRDVGYSAPIIAVTAHALSGDREKTKLAGCDEYLTKPVKSDVLIETILQQRHRYSLKHVEG